MYIFLFEQIHPVSKNDKEDWSSHYKFMEALFNSYDDKISELTNENNKYNVSLKIIKTNSRIRKIIMQLLLFFYVLKYLFI